MNRKQKIIVSTTGIFLVLLILVGLTYAYFLTRINGNKNDKSISVSTANLELKYDDIEQVLISEENVEPGKTWTKKFSATNTGSKKVESYGVALENVINTLKRTEDLVYTLNCTSSLGTNCNKVEDEQEFPTMGKILVTNSIESKEVQSYELIITYKEQNVDQSVDMNKQFSAKVNIVNPSTFNPYVGSMLNSVIIGSAKNASEESDATRTTLGSEVTEFTSISGENERVLNNAPDDYGTSYYYRGNVLDNYVSFADKTWRIVRINGDGSVRLVLDDVVSNSGIQFNNKCYDNACIGYMYGTVGSTTYDATHENINDSTIKIAVDKWYEDNIKTNYANYLQDTLFCNDKTLASNGIGEIETQLGYGENKTYYSSAERLQYSTGTTSITTSKPTFKCAENAKDTYSRFTVNETTLLNGNKTNGDLTYPIGLLTADEVAYAGAYKSEQLNQYYYLSLSPRANWWLMTPKEYNVESFQWYVYAFAIRDTMVSDFSGFRPSINLKINILVSEGTGTKENPYTLKLS